MDYDLNANIRIMGRDVYLLTRDHIWVYYNLEQEVGTLGDGQNRDWAYDQEKLPAEYILELVVQSGGVYLDVGANNGYFYTLKVARNIPDVKVFAFEPDQAIQKHLTKNIAINNLDNITIETCALSDQFEKRWLTAGRGASNYLLNTQDNHEHYQEVNCITLNNYIKDKNIQRIDAIKVDIEGAEFAFLEGARDSISTFRPVIIIELDELLLKRSGHDIDEVFRFFDQLDYEYCHLQGGRDFLAYPQENRLANKFQELVDKYPAI